MTRDALREGAWTCVSVAVALGLQVVGALVPGHQRLLLMASGLWVVLASLHYRSFLEETKR